MADLIRIIQPTRRILFGTGAAAALALAAPAKAASSHPDAALIAVCAEFVAIEQRYRAIYDSLDLTATDEEAAALAAPGYKRQKVLLNLMRDLRATTPEGIQARAYALADANRENAFSFDAPGTSPDRMLSYLRRDSIALAEGALV